MEDLYDLFDDCKNNSFLYEFNYEQSMISKKNENNLFSVERDYINSKEFYDKFEKLPVDRETQLAIYKQTCRLLEFVDGQEEERMVAVSARTGEYLVDNFLRNGSMDRTGFTNIEYNAIKNCRDFVVTIHNHSLNGRPSAQDIITCLKDEKLKFSVVACHSGELYLVGNVKSQFETKYNQIIEQLKLSLSDMKEIKCLAMTRMNDYNDSLGKKQKLFTIIKL